MKRRDFISSAATLGVGSTVAAGGILSSCSGNNEKLVPIRPYDLYTPDLTKEVAIDGKPLKAGLIGCGGRGTGAATNFLDAGPNLQITALADVFPDKVNNSRQVFKKAYNMDIPEDKCFTGLDAYKKVIESDVDVVILATPCAFRPAHFEAAVEAGKHVFMEKPACVDPAGYKSIKATAKKAEAQGLSVVAGTHHRYQRAYLEAFKMIIDGVIGQVVSGTMYWGDGWGWSNRARDPKWSDSEFMIRSWQNWNWLSGGIMEELQIHHIDLINWLMGAPPVRAFGQGARHHPITGDTYDMVSVNYEYEGGINFATMVYRIIGNDMRQSEYIQGSKGSFESVQWGETMMEIRDLKDNLVWKWDGEKEKEQFKYTASTGVYILEHVDFVNHIRSNTPVNQAIGLADSSLTAIMGREAAQTGRIITWDEISNSQLNLQPEKLELGPMDMSKYVVPVQGDPERKPKVYNGRGIIV